MHKLIIQRRACFCSHGRQAYKRVVLSITVLIGLALAACGPSQNDINAQSTLVAWREMSTLFAPTLTSTPTSAPTATAILNKMPTLTGTTAPTLTSTPTITPTLTPTPEAVLISGILIVHDGPGPAYAQLGRFTTKDRLDIIGQFENCRWLKLKSLTRALAGWVPGDKQYVKYQTACGSIPPGTFRPTSSLIVSNQKGGGYGYLKILNGTAEDSVVILTINDMPSKTAYIRAAESYTMQGVGNNTYNLYFTKGSDWDGKEFLTNPTYQRFQDPLNFATTSTTTTTTTTTWYHTWQVTLGAFTGLTGIVNKVANSDFPPIGN